MSSTDRVKLPVAGSAVAWLSLTMANITQGLATITRPARAGYPPIRRDYTRIAIGAAVAAVVIVLLMLYADGPIAQAAKDEPRWVYLTFERISEFGKSGWFLYPLGVALLVIAALASPALSRASLLVLAVLSTRLGFLFLAIGAPSLFVTIIKRLIGRARPHVGGGAADPFHFVQFVWRADFASMPSGHATTAFAAAVAFGIVWPSLRPLLAVYAVAVAVSRILVHAHFVSDVVTGAIVGMVGAILVRDWFAARHLGFMVDPDGSVRALPGPSLGRIKKVARERVGS